MGDFQDRIAGLSRSPPPICAISNDLTAPRLTADGQSGYRLTCPEADNRLHYGYRQRNQLQFAITEKRRGLQGPRVVNALPQRYAVKFFKRDLN